MKPPNRSERLLTQWESDTRLIGLFLATGLVKNTKAQSLLLVGPYGEGKSEIMRRFAALPSITMLSDVTPNGVKRLIEADPARKIRHYLVTEFARIQNHDFSVSQQMAVMFASLMSGDGGVEIVGRDKPVDLKGVQLGVIAAMTTGMFEEQKSGMERTGLLSRFTILPVFHDREERQRILGKMAVNDESDKEPILWGRFYLPAPVRVDYTANVGRELLAWFTDLGLKESALVRRFDTVKSLLLATALLNGRTATTRDDLATLQRFAGYFQGDKGVRLLWPVRETAARKE